MMKSTTISEALLRRRIFIFTSSFLLVALPWIFVDPQYFGNRGFFFVLMFSIIVTVHLWDKKSVERQELR